MSEPLRHILPSFIFFLSYLKPCHLSAGLNRLLIFNRITYSNPFFAVSFVVWCHCSGSRAVCCGQSLLLEQILFLPSPKQVGAYFWKKRSFRTSGYPLTLFCHAVVTWFENQVLKEQRNDAIYTRWYMLNFYCRENSGISPGGVCSCTASRSHIKHN